MKSPCKDCTERSMKCHSKCVDYLAFKEHREKVSANKVAQNETYYAMQSIKRRNGKRGRS